MVSLNIIKLTPLAGDTEMPDDARVTKIQEALLNWTPPFALKVLKYLMKFLSEVRISTNHSASSDTLGRYRSTAKRTK